MCHIRNYDFVAFVKVFYVSKVCGYFSVFLYDLEQYLSQALHAFQDTTLLWFSSFLPGLSFSLSLLFLALLPDLVSWGTAVFISLLLFFPLYAQSLEIFWLICFTYHLSICLWLSNLYFQPRTCLQTPITNSYYTSPLGCLLDIANVTCPELNPNICHPLPPSLLVDFPQLMATLFILLLIELLPHSCPHTVCRIILFALPSK